MTHQLADARLHLQRYHALVLELQRYAQARVQEQPTDAAWREMEQRVTQGLAHARETESANTQEVMRREVTTAQVTVRPSGHAFWVEGHATLLQSGLRAGLRLNYGCGNGSCGMCKVRVISGEVVQTQHSDYPLSEAEKAQGYALMCCHSAASSELTLELLEATGPQDIPEQQIVTHVRAITSLAPNTRLLHVQTPRSHRLRFLAGQSVRLSWRSSEKGDVQSTYPVASCPCDDRNVLFVVSREAGDALAPHLFSGDIQVGSALTLLGPHGDFVLADGYRPLVFAACDEGFAPIKSLIEHALSLDTVPSISLFWLATRSDGHFFSNQCRAWSEALDPFEYELVSHTDVVMGAQQIAQAMRADLFDIDCDFYLAGPVAFVNALRDALRAVGVAQAQIVTFSEGTTG